MRAPRERRRDLFWSALFLLASAIGALAAADIAHVSTFAALLVAVLVTAALTLLIYYGPLNQNGNDNADRAAQHAGEQERYRRLPKDHPSRLTERHQETEGTALGQREHVAVRLMQMPPPVAPPWWQPGQTGQAAAGETAAEAPVAPKLSNYLDSALIAQCPNCGSFRIDANQTAPQWQFRCQECRQAWVWLPGDPWPAVQVRPHLRKGRQQPPPQRGPAR
jgi:predicted Zn finger-like uncharacterized protein